MTIDEWKENCQCGCFVNDDGIGDLAYHDQISNISVYPSMIFNGEFEKIKGDFTHVVWFNK